MNITTISSRQFNQDAGGAKKAALSGPVVITDRGKPAHVLLSFEAYQRMTRQHARIADLLAMPDTDEIVLDLPSQRDLAQAADLY